MARNIMREKKLSPESKCIYAYLASFTDENSQCFPTRKLMLNELGMSENRFSKYMKELTDAGIVEVKKTRNGNIFGHNVYTIHHEISIKECNVELTSGVKYRHSQNESAEDNKKYVQFRHSQIGSAELWSSNNVSTNNTSINNTSLNNNSNKESKAKRFIPPTVEDVQAYCNERNNGIDAERFIDFYTSKGWMVGKNKMKDWKAAVRTWEQRNKTTEQNTVATSQKEKPFDNGYEGFVIPTPPDYKPGPDDPFQ